MRFHAGDGKRGHGILHNQLYVGRLVHNRTSKVPEPVTRTTRIRVNAIEDRAISMVPHLRIVDDETWEAVQARRRSYHGAKLHRTVRPRRMLSGLGTCGICGEGWIVIGVERWGCTKHKSDGSCSNNRHITTGEYERRVLAGLRERMLDSTLIEVFVREYHAEYARKAATSRRDEAKLQRQVVEARGKVDRLVAAIANGGAEFADVRDALAKARSELDTAERSRADVEAMPVVALHPKVATDYRRQVETLNEALADPEASLEAIPALRNLIDRIVVTPNPTGRGVFLDVEGRLAAILDLASGNSGSGERLFVMERVKGIEPSSLAWEAKALPLSYTRERRSTPVGPGLAPALDDRPSATVLAARSTPNRPANQLAAQTEHLRTVRLGHQSLEHRPEPRYRALPCARIRVRHPDPCRLEQFALHLRTLGRQPQQPLPPVALARPRLDQLAVGEFVQHAAQRLLGDRQQRQQFADRHVGLARYEIQRPVVRAPQPLFGKPLVDRPRQMAIAEIQQLHTASEFGFAKEQG